MELAGAPGDLRGAAGGMDTYVHAPKDDPYHRQRWREPYPEAELDGFASLVEERTLRVGIGISPGLSMDTDSASDRSALLEKLDQLTSVGISLVGLLLDDLEPSEGAGLRHGALTSWLRSELDPSVDLFMVPLHYTGVERVPYLEQLASTVPEEVPIGWTGRHVVNRSIGPGDARERAEVMGRPPLLWDNTPVNDAVMSRHLFTGPLRGRDPEVLDHVSGYLANPMVQARAGLPALLSAAAWCRGEDPSEVWDRALGVDRALLEGCDGRVPGALAEAGLAGGDDALAALEAWFAEAEHCTAGSLGDVVQPWVDQLRAESTVARLAVELLRSDVEEARRSAPLLYLTWPRVRSASHEVLGGRGSLLPAMGQDRASRWVASGESYVPPASVTDRLVAAVFERLGDGEGSTG